MNCTRPCQNKASTARSCSGWIAVNSTKAFQLSEGHSAEHEREQTDIALPGWYREDIQSLLARALLRSAISACSGFIRASAIVCTGAISCFNSTPSELSLAQPLFQQTAGH